MREDMYLNQGSLNHEDALRTLMALKVSDAATVILQALQEQVGLWDALKEAAEKAPIEDQRVDILGKIVGKKDTLTTVNEQVAAISDATDATNVDEVASLVPESNGNATNSVKAPDIDPVPTKPTCTQEAVPVSAEQNVNAADSGKMPDVPPVLKGEGSASAEASAIIQFSTGIFYCMETEGNMTIDVMLLGGEEIECSCNYETRDSTAKAGQRYKHSAGQLHFKSGETSKEIQVPIIQNELWDSTVEFEVVLTNPVGATLGRYLDNCRVKVLDDDTFPTNKFYDVLHDGVPDEIDRIPKAALLMEYFKMNFSNPVVRRGTLKMFVVDQMHNWYFIWRLILMRYLINQVLIESADEDNLLLFPGKPRFVLFFIMCAVILPNVFIHMLDVRKLTWKVGGTSRKTIQANLLRKFLNYDENSRKYVKEADLIMAMTRDTNDLTGGYGKVMPLVEDIGKLVVILLYQMINPLVQGKQPKPVVVLPLLIFPVLMLTFLRIRNAKTLRVSGDQDAKQNALVAHVDNTVMDYRLIADYNRRPYFVDQFEKLIGKFNNAVTTAGIVTLNNKKFAPWLSTIISGMYIVWGGLAVLERDGTASLGGFIVNLEIFKAIGDSWGDIYVVMLDLQNVFPALGHIVTFMNLPVDVKKRMQQTRQRRAEGKKQRASLREERKASLKDPTISLSLRADAKEKSPVKTTLVDELDIRMDNVKYSYTQAGTLECEIIAGTFAIPQGSFTAFVGHRGQGKTTLLKLIGGVLLPEDGIFVPPHLRVLHISEQPLFFDGTLLENLTFGVKPSDDDGQISRVIAICRKLHIPENIIKLMSMDTRVEWEEVLSLTQRTLLNIARSLVANPEVLCIHKPTVAFDNHTAKNTLQELRRFVDEKGVEQDPTKLHLRRPRTCIITAARTAGVDVADQVFQVDSKLGVVLIDKSAVQDDMLS